MSNLKEVKDLLQVFLDTDNQELLSIIVEKLSELDVGDVDMLYEEFFS